MVQYFKFLIQLTFWKSCLQKFCGKVVCTCVLGLSSWGRLYAELCIRVYFSLPSPYKSDLLSDNKERKEG